MYQYKVKVFRVDRRSHEFIVEQAADEDAARIDALPQAVNFNFTDGKVEDSQYEIDNAAVSSRGIQEDTNEILSLSPRGNTVNTERIQEVLRSMGYRPMDSNRMKWGKPIGNTILLFSLDAMTLEQLFRNIRGEARLWIRSDFDEASWTSSADGEPEASQARRRAEAVCLWIRSFETWQIRLLDAAPAGTPAFEFLTPEDRETLVASAAGIL